MENTEIKDHLNKMTKSYDKLIRFVYVSFLLIALSLIGAGFINAKAIGGLQTRTEILWKEYVPGDLFMAIIHSYDLQNKYIISLMNGNSEQAEKAINDFVEFRDQMYERRFSSRGISPVEGRVYKPLK